MTKYWRSLEELKDPTGFKKEELRLEAESKKNLLAELSNSSRRDFLKIFGFSIGAAVTVASCKKPIDKAIPFLIKPEDVTPGMANYYASSFYDGSEYCSILVKVRDGRPIKIEGNALSSVSQRGTSAKVQASVLDLYDEYRFKSPLKENNTSTWEVNDKEITEALTKLKTENRTVALLTSTIISPSTKKIIEQFIAVYPNVKWVQYDAISASGILNANEKSFGKAFIPDYRFDKAKVIVSFGADFLGTWLSPVEYTKGYSKGRRLLEDTKEINRHYQFESGMTLTGSNADVRVTLKPSEEQLILASLYNNLLKGKGLITLNLPECKTDLSDLAADLLANTGNSIVVSGSNDANNQLIVNAINQLLGNYGKTILNDVTLNTKQGKDEEVENMINEVLTGNVGGVIFCGVNPVYDHYKGEKLKDALSKLELSVSLAGKNDETTAVCKYVCPSPHYLESWDDAEPKTGIFSLIQPTIHKLFDNRQPQESLSKWSGEIKPDYCGFIQKYWSENIAELQTGMSDFRSFWNDSLQKGVFETVTERIQLTYSETGLSEAVSGVKGAGSNWEIVLYENITAGNGSYANNPWLQELPDPVAKISWDNFASVPVKWAEENKIGNESVIQINGVELPVFVQPGQASETISVALGYGRTISGKAGTGIGKNLIGLTTSVNGNRSYVISSADVVKTDKAYELALSQTHHSMEGRPIARETSMEEWLVNPAAGNELSEQHKELHVSLYKKQEFTGHHWGMAVDLSSCTGCTNCSISCQAENNTAVIGKKQVRNRRIMHWVRIDRYFSDDAENPKVLFQPVMCQHCDNAPCENVCPVSATPHSSEGLNQIAYNRCVGTKYCMNNCPYKVRRFNWFKYTENEEFDFNGNSDLGRMVFNPDVTVRSRGVVEKCTFCVQRIQEKKALAKVEGRPLADGEIQPACVQSCPADALVFGDLNDPESKISKLYQNKRNYFLLEELHTLPKVGYLTKVRNIKA